MGAPRLVPIPDATFQRDVVHTRPPPNCPPAIVLFPSISHVPHDRLFHVFIDQNGDLQNRMSRSTFGIRKPRILIVDDDDVLRRWLREQLEPRGYEVWEESQGDEALATYEHNAPWSFVLSDLYFYRGEGIRNGLELLRAIGQINPAQRMAIHTSEKGLEAPVRVITKPYPIGRLLRLLREHVRRLELPFTRY